MLTDTTLAGAQFDVVDDRAHWNILDRKRVTDFDVGGRPGFYELANAQTQRRQDITLFAIAVVQQRDPARTVRIVLDRRDLRRHAILRTLEVDDAVLPARPTAAMAHGDMAVEIAARVLLANLDQRALGLDLGEIRKIEGG